MRSRLFFSLFTVLGLSFALGCGGRNGGNPPEGDTELTGDSDGATGTPCTDNSECRSGVCEGGFCAAAVSCTNHGDCPADQYCHFPSNPVPWQSETEGTCSGSCTTDASCGITGQECHEFNGMRRCYTNIPCDPANNSADCPPGEVCSRDSNTCRWPADVCYFQEDCPVGWVCDTEGRCIDPSRLGECSIDDDCVGTPGCEVGCACFDGACQVQGSCDPTGDDVAQCGAGNYCAGGVCREAYPCPNGQNDCTPRGLVCVDDFCANPDPCTGSAPDYECPEGFQCLENFDPPACFPDGFGECSRDEMCPPAHYCELFTGTCEPGCRSDEECVDACPGADYCGCGATNCDYCGHDHQCTDTATTELGEPCEALADCPGGTMCVLEDSGADTQLLCGVDPSGSLGGTASCDRACFQVCDTVVSMVYDSCPDGYVCGGDGETAETLIGLLMGKLFEFMTGGGEATNPNVSACYPETQP